MGIKKRTEKRERFDESGENIDQEGFSISTYLNDLKKGIVSSTVDGDTSENTPRVDSHQKTPNDDTPIQELDAIRDGDNDDIPDHDDLQ